MAHDLVSIIVPTRNSVKTISHLLKSLKESTDRDFELIIVDSMESTDHMRELCSKYSQFYRIQYLKGNIHLPQARNLGVRYATGSILLHLDSDMSLTKTLIGECRELIHAGFDALIIPEFAIGYSYWAKVKALEKNMYQGEREIESIRCITLNLFNKLRGYNEDLYFSEDKDFDLRAQQIRSKIGRAESCLIHYEGNFHLFDFLRKKALYAKSASKFKHAHVSGFSWQKNPFIRYGIFWKKRDAASSDLELYSLYILKTLEYVVSFIAYR